MTENIVSASDNPGLVNELISQALGEPEQTETEIEIALPSDNVIDLPGGFVTPTGEVVRTLEVRELTGRDEEAISRASTVGRVLNTILSRAIVKIGDMKATEGMLDQLLAGDRDEALLGIYRATFGPVAETLAWCDGCQESKTIGIDIKNDIKRKVLVDPVGDRRFTVKGRVKEYTVVLPNGRCQRELNSSLDKTVAELTTVLLENTVEEIDGVVVYNKALIQNMGTADRRTIAQEISERNPGPQFEEVSVTCPDCDSEVVVPVSIGDLFRF